MLSSTDIHRLYLGHFTAPDDDHRAGQKIFVCAYLIEHPDGPILLDTGIASGHEETERQYHPVRRPLEDELARVGRRVDEIRAVVNCHLHLDHSGGNARFPGTPVVVLAGQAYNAASDYARAQYAWELERDGSTDRGTYLEWVARMQEFDPWRVLFAHDVSIWERDQHPRGGTV